jgi:hypothetical protein
MLWQFDSIYQKEQKIEKIAAGRHFFLLISRQIESFKKTGVHNL